eukprot:scaffold7364_cov130-Isochrysis_galbana.AAC.3
MATSTIAGTIASIIRESFQLSKKIKMSPMITCVPQQRRALADWAEAEGRARHPRQPSSASAWCFWARSVPSGLGCKRPIALHHRGWGIMRWHRLVRGYAVAVRHEGLEVRRPEGARRRTGSAWLHTHLRAEAEAHTNVDGDSILDDHCVGRETIHQFARLVRVEKANVLLHQPCKEPAAQPCHDPFASQGEEVATYKREEAADDEDDGEIQNRLVEAADLGGIVAGRAAAAKDPAHHVAHKRGHRHLRAARHEEGHCGYGEHRQLRPRHAEQPPQGHLTRRGGRGVRAA